MLQMTVSAMVAGCIPVVLKQRLQFSPDVSLMVTFAPDMIFGTVQIGSQGAGTERRRTRPEIRVLGIA